MDPLKDYVIPFKGLKNGIHKMSYRLTNRFFTQFEYSIIKEGDFEVEVTLDRRDSLMIFDFEINGFFRGECDRCLNQINIPANSQNRLHVKIGEEQEGDYKEDIVYIPPNDFEINLATFLYEFVHTGMPLMKLRDCESENFKYCNQKVLDKLYDQHINQEETPTENPFSKALRDLNLN